jgi:hypothetical protein
MKERLEYKYTTEYYNQGTVIKRSKLKRKIREKRLKIRSQKKKIRELEYHIEEREKFWKDKCDVITGQYMDAQTRMIRKMTKLEEQING